ncbi:hypothetical protein [Saccharopolyspora rosea]|uniref:Uncharacterized protein n=1 Tax=Saccharopolyspora rosea TaxID=524884 RepID=A0ABW3FVH6_9PSEU|nr:hypothetical protein [Saccharopolyspora rosea]
MAKLGKPILNWRRRRALSTARLLDDLVTDQVWMLPHLSPDSRRRSADHLAELTMLGQAYRYYAIGWISRRELQRRGRAAADRLAEIRCPTTVQFTDDE